MQYYVWDGDTTGRIIVDRVMKAADRGAEDPAHRVVARAAPPPPPGDPLERARNAAVAALDMLPAFSPARR